ncbi:hypothetical protein BC952_0207 [Flavobacterium limicola]|uniref:Uncharacterized protein n=2 Tax=Flavobacterium limicola TaxID=180441 RepID=A0A495S427_9FLAO|nr:hypothetical protein BC952_0207 [Flavobacterium limicola]
MFFAESVTLNKSIEINQDKFIVKKYATPIIAKDKTIAMYKKIEEDISMKIRTSLPRDVKITSTKTETKGVDENDFIEKSFDDIK